MSDEYAIHPAIAAWSAALDPSRVDASAETIARYARTMQPRGTAPRCVLYPESVADVQAIARIAQEHACPIYPISGGRNWGYGDACAPEPGAAIVDLGRMRQILEINAELGYAVIEPGVTQQQLYEAVCVRAGLLGDIGAGPMRRSRAMRSNALRPRLTAITCEAPAAWPVARMDASWRPVSAITPARKRSTSTPTASGPFPGWPFLQSNSASWPAWASGCTRAPRPSASHPRSPRRGPGGGRGSSATLRMHGILNSAVHLGNDFASSPAWTAIPERRMAKRPPPALREELRAETRLGA